MLVRDDALACRVRAGARRDGAPGLVVSVRALPQVEHVALGPDGSLVVEGRLVDPGPATLALRSRLVEEEVSVPAQRDGERFRAQVDARRLVRATLGHEEVWDAFVAVEGLRGEARLGCQLDRHRMFPERRLRRGREERAVHPYVTRDANLSVRCAREDEVVEPGPRPSRTEGPLLRRLGLRPVVLALRVARAGAFAALARRTPPHAPSPPGARPRVTFLLQHAYGMGGTIRTTLATAAHLAERCDVEILTLQRARDEPFFELPDGLTVRTVDDLRPGRHPGRAGRLLRRLPSVLFHEGDFGYRRQSLWADLQLVRALRGTRADVLVGTRPALNLIVAHLAPPGVVTVGQEHMHVASHLPGLRRALRRGYRRLDALTVLTAADERDYGRLLAGAATRVVRVPNAVPPLDGPQAALQGPVVAAVGRLTHQKGFDLLLEAWARVAPRRPGWTLHLHGAGVEGARLRWQAHRLGLEDSVRFMGPTRHVGRALARASVFALSSRFEGFGMVVLEAMSKGLPVVSFDCPQGPGELITDGVDGVLVPPEDVAALADALARVMGDEGERRRLAEGGLRRARDFDPAVVEPRWDALFDELLRSRARTAA
jgi:glycosyltransferase involved in cell wall biosynthesis